jgi:hypothetical protein
LNISYSRIALAALSLSTIWSGIAAADDNGLRSFIGKQVGGIQNLRVPPTNADIPVPPPPPPGTPAAPPATGPFLTPDRFVTTEAKRFLGKLLFHDPVRTARININQGVPVDLPAGTAFGGTVNGSDPNVAAIVTATKQTGSCGSCHIGEAAGKAGQQINLHVGAEGRGFTDEEGNFIPRRRPQPFLTKLRTAPIFPGDTLVDALPTLTDIDLINGVRVVTTPADFHHTPLPQALLATGRLDELDAVGRFSPGLVGFAFNNRLLLGGFGGEPTATIGSLNPNDDPAGEDITLELLDAHRMLGFQSAELQKIPAFVELFRQAFPTEAANFAKSGNLNDLVNDDTELRAQATFLRTVVTRNTPFDRFLAGDDSALTDGQQAGARLFFTEATKGGAGCFTCHSGPMLNKQPNDPDVAGIGQFVEENFFNVGIGDHPVRALSAQAKGQLNPSRLGSDGFPYHADDTGREEVTRTPDDMFKFRVLTMRQLKVGRNFTHSGSFTKVRDVVEYFNAGIPQDPTAGAAPTLSTRFTNPRGPLVRGLGLSEEQVDDITDFLENALFDPALVRFDPNSSTDTFQPNERDVTYSQFHPELVPLGAKDGFLLSGLAIDSNDPLTRRDEGLEFLDVTTETTISLVSRQVNPTLQDDVYRITNSSTSIIDTNLLVIAQGLPRGVRLLNGSGTTSGGVPLENGSATTSAGEPFQRVFLPSGVLQPGQTIVQELRFQRPPGLGPLQYQLQLLSGQGNP